MKDHKGAFADLKEMLRIQPNSRATYRLCGLIKTDLQDYYGALLDITKFLKIDTTDVEMWKTRGYCRDKVKDFKGAISDYSQALKIHPQSEELLTAIADTYYQVGDTIKCIDAIRKIGQLQPKNIRVTLTLADLFISIKKYDSCHHYLKAILSSKDVKYNNPINYAAAQFINAKMLTKVGDIDGALRSLDICLRIDSNHLEARLLRAKSYLTLKDESSAIKDLIFLKGKSYTPGEDLYVKFKL